MPTLPAQPDLDQLRRQAKDLLRAARSGDADARRELRRVSDRVTLAAAQLALARSYGFASWPRLTAEVEARALDLGAKVDAFCRASINGRLAQAARLLASTPAIARSGFAAALILGDAARVDDELRRDPGLATRRDPRWGWTPLHAVCASRWHQLEPRRGDGLLAVARRLVAAGADPTALRAGTGWSPLRCAVASANSGPSNRPVVELLLEHGVVPDDHDLYLAGFAHDREQLLPLLLGRVPNASAVAEQALAAPVGNDDVDAARRLLEAGADPQRYRDDDGHPVSIVWAAVRAGCGTPLLESLLAHGADPNGAGPDGYTPYRLATASGRVDLCDLLRRHGADERVAPADRLLSACVRGDGAGARRELDADPGLLASLDDHERAALVRAAGSGTTAAVELMLDLGFPLDARGEAGATALHAAAHAGSLGTVRLLLDRGADTEARDTTWNSTPLVWAVVGSGERPDDDPAADWTETVRALLDHGASTQHVVLDPDDPIQPSPDVAALLRVRAERS